MNQDFYPIHRKEFLFDQTIKRKVQKKFLWFKWEEEESFYVYRTREDLYDEMNKFLKENKATLINMVDTTVYLRYRGRARGWVETEYEPGVRKSGSLTIHYYVKD